MTVRAFVSVEYALNRAGSDVPDAVAGPHVVDTPALAANRSAVQLMNDIADAAIAKAAELGYTLNNGDVLMCGLQKI